MSDETPEQIFERKGTAEVRLLVQNSGLPQQMMLPAIQWLAQRDEEDRARSEASQTEQNQIARSAKKAAWTAAVAAIVAAIIAVVAMFISYLSWIFPRH